MAQPQRHSEAFQLDLEAQRSRVLVVRPAATALKAQRRQRLRRLCGTAQRCLSGLQLVQLSPCLARLVANKVGKGAQSCLLWCQAGAAGRAQLVSRCAVDRWGRPARWSAGPLTNSRPHPP